MQSRIQTEAEIMSLNSELLTSGKLLHEMAAHGHESTGNALNRLDPLDLLSEDKSHMLVQNGNIGNSVNGNNNGVDLTHASKHHIPFNGLSYHNPFDVNSYPLTNPPLYDPTMLPLGSPGYTRRRRISISNGQIGQIVNHEAFYIDDESLEDYNDIGQPIGHSLIPHIAHDSHQNHNYQHLTDENMRVHHNIGHPLGSLDGQSLPISGASLNGNRSSLPINGVLTNDDKTGLSIGGALMNDVRGLPVGGAIMNADRPDMCMSLTANSGNSSKNGIANIGGYGLNGLKISSSISSGLASPSVAGVPPKNQTLVYNNEVIYNPHDGPIPGTAAWKKERLLERNRVAASKCRQRKKHAQEQLHTNMARFEREIREKDQKLEKAEKLLDIYRSALQQHFDGDVTALDTVRPFLKRPHVKSEPDT